jgi:hypothetical protein
MESKSIKSISLKELFTRMPTCCVSFMALDLILSFRSLIVLNQKREKLAVSRIRNVQKNQLQSTS